MEIDWLALSFLILFWGAFYFLQRWRKSLSPVLYFSSLQDFINSPSTLPSRLSSLPQKLLYAALAAFSLAFLDIHWVSPPSANVLTPPETPKEGIAIYLVLDHSGSMDEKVLDTSAKGYRSSLPKIDTLKRVTKEFVEGDPESGLTGRPNDLIGIVQFSRRAEVLVPLTLDHQSVIENLDQIAVSNAEEDQGTSIGYAIYKTASVIAATRHFAEALSLTSEKLPYAIKSAVIILVTDGFQDVNPKDRGNRFRSMEVEQAAAYAKAQDIKLYVINVDPRLNTKQFEPNRHQMQKLAESTGGAFFMVDQGRPLDSIYKTINFLEKSSLPSFGVQAEAALGIRTFSLYPYFIALGLLFMGCSILSETTWLRKLP